jgi:toxin ParE1/3/4
MRLPIVFRRIASREFDNAIAWYEREQPGLGGQFKAEIDSYLEKVSRSPLLFRRIRGDARRAVVRRFPYCIYFLPEPQRVVILAVWHAKRDPQELTVRLGR